MQFPALVLAALLSLGLAGCNRTAEGNPNATGRSGSGNAAVVVAPGTSGRGAADAGASSAAGQPGTGLAGGMGAAPGIGMTGTFPSGTTTQSAAAAAATDGSPNRTPRSGVGTR